MQCARTAESESYAGTEEKEFKKSSEVIENQRENERNLSPKEIYHASLINGFL